MEYRTKSPLTKFVAWPVPEQRLSLLESLVDIPNSFLLTPDAGELAQYFDFGVAHVLSAWAFEDKKGLDFYSVWARRFEAPAAVFELIKVYVSGTMAYTAHLGLTPETPAVDPRYAQAIKNLLDLDFTHAQTKVDRLYNAIAAFDKRLHDAIVTNKDITDPNELLYASYLQAMEGCYEMAPGTTISEPAITPPVIWNGVECMPLTIVNLDTWVKERQSTYLEVLLEVMSTRQYLQLELKALMLKHGIARPGEFGPGKHTTSTIPDVWRLRTASIPVVLQRTFVLGLLSGYKSL